MLVLPIAPPVFADVVRPWVIDVYQEGRDYQSFAVAIDNRTQEYDICPEGVCSISGYWQNYTIYLLPETKEEEVTLAPLNGSKPYLSNQPLLQALLASETTASFSARTPDEEYREFSLQETPRFTRTFEYHLDTESFVPIYPEPKRESLPQRLTRLLLWGIAGAGGVGLAVLLLKVLSR